MTKKLLITFGCSWTYGVGAGYQPGMSMTNFRDIEWDNSIANKLSFRGIISKKLNYTNKNFSAGGDGGNQQQFRLAKEYFSSKEFDRDREYYDEIVLLWGITSIYRDELYSNLTDENINFIHHDNNRRRNKSLDLYLKYFFNDDNEIRKIALDVLFWDKFFSKNNVTNYWFDTFNHLDYPIPRLANLKKTYNKCSGTDWPQWDDLITQNIHHVDPEILNEIYDTERWEWSRILTDFPGFNNFIDFTNKNRDIASYLARHNGLENLSKQIHTSVREADTDCIKFLADVGIVNPFSFHPTQRGHQQLADYFIEKMSVK